MQSGTLGRLLAVAVLAVAILAVVGVFAPGVRRAPDPGIATTSTAPPDQTAPASLPAACDLVTATDAQQVFGVPFAATQQTDASCTHASGDASPLTVRVDVRAAPAGADDHERKRDEAVRTFGVGAITDIEDLGDAAFLTLQADVALLQIVSGRISLVIGVAGPAADPAASALALGELAMSRM